MRARLEHFFKRNMGLAIVILLFAVFTLVFVIPKIFLSFEPSEKKNFFGSFLLSFGIIMFVIFGPKFKNVSSSKEKITPSRTNRSYQQLLDEAKRCFRELKKQQMWAYGCLYMGWIILLVGRLSEHPPYNHSIFAIPVFGLAFLAATKSWEKENELDMSIAECAIEGLEAEKNRQGLNSSLFHHLANSYEGYGMWKFAIMRAAPFLMILFSLFYVGLLSPLAAHLSVPREVLSIGSGVILGIAFLFYARMACRPYYWLLEKRKTIVL